MIFELKKVGVWKKDHIVTLKDIYSFFKEFIWRFWIASTQNMNNGVLKDNVQSIVDSSVDKDDRPWHGLT